MVDKGGENEQFAHHKSMIDGHGRGSGRRQGRGGAGQGGAGRGRLGPVRRVPDPSGRRRTGARVVGRMGAVGWVLFLAGGAPGDGVDRT